MTPLKRKLSVSLLALLALALPACGGGGGVDPITGGGGVVVVDGPEIVSTAPAAGEVDVDPAALVEVVFDRALDAANLPADAIVVRYGAATVTGQVSYDAARQALVFTPLNDLLYATDYDVEVAAGIMDLDGNPTADPFAFSFRVVDRLFIEQPHEVEVDPSHAKALAISEIGEGASAYITEHAFSWELSIRMYAKATGFAAPQSLYNGPTQVHMDLFDGLAVNENGQGIIGYRMEGASNDAAAVRLFNARSGAVGPFVSVSTPGADARNPRVDIDHEGNALVIWTEQVGSGDIRLYARSYDSVTGWGTRFRVEPNSGDVLHYEIGMNDDGHAVMAWKLALGDDRAARARTWFEAAYGAVRTVHYVPGTRADLEGTEVLNNGESLVFYTVANTPAPTQFTLKVMRYRPSTLSNPGWQGAEFIDDVGGGFLRSTTSQINGREALVAWGVDAPDGTTKLRYRRYIPGPIGWEAAINLTNLPISTFQNHILRSVSADKRHTLFFWSYDNGGADPERRATLVVDGVPAFRDLLLPGRGDFGPSVGMDGQGNSLIVDWPDATLIGLNAVTVDAFGNVSGPVRIDSGIGGPIIARYLQVDRDGGAVLLFDRLENAQPNANSDVFHLIRD